MRYLLTSLLCVLTLYVTAQLPNGSVAPDFTATDIDGNEWTLYDLLDEGNTVILNFGATWTGPDWSYFQSGILQDLFSTFGPEGTGELYVFYLESDDSTTAADLNGNGTATIGDWVSIINFPIIDNASNIFDGYSNTYYPTIYTVCPDGTPNATTGEMEYSLVESGQTSFEGHVAAFVDCANSISQTPFFEEDFESYQVGDYIGATSADWTTWSGAVDPTGGAEDGQVSDEQANSGTQSLKIFGSVAGGPMDIYLPIGLESAHEVSYNIYVPSGGSAYMNVQGFQIPGTLWAFDMVFSCNGSIQLSIDNVSIAFGSYNLDEWTSVSLRMDPVNDRAEVFIGGEYIENFAFDGIIGGLDFFGFGDGNTAGLYYIDDVVVVETDDVFSNQIPGCMFEEACNYDPDATIYDGSCLANDECGMCGGDNSTCLGCDGVPNSGLVDDQCGVCGGDGSSCIQTCVDDDDAVSVVGGCVNAVELLGCSFYWGEEILISELCPESCYSCPCDNDFNDNGVCDENEIFGCTYIDAINYDSLATTDDGSCMYDDVSSDCPSDIDGDGTVTTQDLLSFLSFFGETCDSSNILGCTDSSSCTYNPEATEGDGSCLSLDECGVCGGDNSTCLDECGVPNGDNSTCFTSCGDLVSHDGYDYSTVLIGDQCWFAENCRYLPEVSPSIEGSETAPYYYVFVYEGTDVTAAQATTNYATYGAIYNWPAVMTEGICPSGWHIPSDGEFTQLTDFLGGESVAGGKMKETGYDHWSYPNTGATNSSGWTGLPVGFRYIDSWANNSGGFWWSASESGSLSWGRSLQLFDDDVFRYDANRSNGFSARCVRD